MVRYGLTIGLWLMGFWALGCDICGCSVSGSYFGIFPQYRKHFVGWRASHRTYVIKHPPLFAGEKTVYSNDLSFTNEVWGRFQYKRLQVIAVVPYQYNQRREGDLLLRTSGLGDVTVSVLYHLWRTPDTLKGVFKHSFSIGAGLKMPTGSHTNTVLYNGLVVPGFRLGTGSWDVPLSFLYTLKRKSLGLNTEMTYQWNTPNRYRYQFGNRFSTALRVFYWKYRPSFSFLPQAGLAYEYYQKDQNENIPVPYTGGKVLWSFAGVDVYKARWGLGLHAWLPIHQEVGKQHIKMLPRFNLNLLYLF